jgi:hypothetical protein
MSTDTFHVHDGSGASLVGRLSDMRTPSRPYAYVRCRIALLAVATSLSVGSLHAQSLPGQAGNSATSQKSTAQSAVRIAMDDAKALAKSKNIIAVEAKLGALAHGKAHTPAWHIDIAQRLIQIAEQLSRDGSNEAAMNAAAAALKHANSADAGAADAITHGTAKIVAGFIQERFLADPDAAIASYQAATQLSPKANGAKQALERLKRTADALHGQGGKDTTSEVTP